MLFCSAPFRCRSHLGYSLARLSELCPSLSSRVFAFAVRRVSARCRSFARLCFSLSMPVYACLCLAMLCPRPSAQCHSFAVLCPRIADRSFANAAPFISVLELCTAVPCFAVSLLCFALPSRTRAMQFRFRSNPSSALAVPVDATLRLCLQCFSLASRYIAILSLLHVLLYLTQQIHSHAFQGHAFALSARIFTRRLVSSPGPFNSALRLCISIRNYTFPLRRLAARAFPQLSPW